MGEADRPGPVSGGERPEPREPSPFLGVIGMFAFVFLGMGLTGYGLYRLASEFGPSSRPGSRPARARPSPGAPSSGTQDREPEHAPARPPVKLTPELKREIERLIADLGDNHYKTREKAEKELLAIGEAARPQLEAHRSHIDPEVRFRVQKVLERLDLQSRRRR